MLPLKEVPSVSSLSVVYLVKGDLLEVKLEASNATRSSRIVL